MPNKQSATEQPTAARITLNSNNNPSTQSTQLAGKYTILDNNKQALVSASSSSSSSSDANKVELATNNNKRANNQDDDEREEQQQQVAEVAKPMEASTTTESPQQQPKSQSSTDAIKMSSNKLARKEPQLNNDQDQQTDSHDNSPSWRQKANKRANQAMQRAKLLDMMLRDSIAYESAASSDSGDSAEPEATAQSGSGENDDESNTVLATSTTTTTTTTTTSSPPPKTRKQVDEIDLDSDSAGFEAVANAISNTLNSSRQKQQHQQAPSKVVPVAISLLSEAPLEGDTGAYNNNNQPTEENRKDSPFHYSEPNRSSSNSPDQQKLGNQLTASIRRRLTPGEHVAEVIDHIVKRRRLNTSFSPNANPDQVSGPQILVVAPVGVNDQMKARSLTKASTPEEEKSMKESKSMKLNKQLKSPLKIFTGPKNTLVGGRLLGFGDMVDPNELDNNNRRVFSERVETISDDEPVSMQNKPAIDESDELLRDDYMAPDEDDEPTSNIHVSSQPGEARSRSPRHELGASRMLERYAPMLQENTRQQSSSQAKLYSAEQLIREHVLKSKQKSVALEPKSEAQEPTMKQTQDQLQQQQSQASNGDQVKMLPTTVRPPIQHRAPQQLSSSTTTTTTTTTTTEASAESSTVGQSKANADIRQQHYASGVHPVQVPIIIQQSIRRPMMQQHQADMFQQQQGAESQQHMRYQQMNEQQQQQQRPQASGNIRQPQAVPVFADQEYNVPAHMAESVIQDIQRSPSAIGVFNGQPTLFSVARQVPFQYQPDNQQAAMMQTAASNPSQMHHGPNNQAAIHLVPQQPNNYRPTPQQMWNRMNNVNSNKQHQLQQQQQQQMIANRISVEPSSSPTAQLKSSSFSTTTRGSLVQPVAQMALRHLFSSLATTGTQQTLAQQAMAQQQSLDAQQANEQSGRSMGGPPQQQNAIASQQELQSAGSAPAGSALLPPSGEEAAGRQMRSLPIGAAPDRQQQVQINDQEVQESYGQVPTYHMGGGGHGGAGYGGGNYGQGGGYESDQDKKSKGVTFHFGGGPIGGGTQLITSPMGIFKHLMIPLMPNPRVNLNGKIVFGVVLEKSTAFGPPPKKKYKFWGR